MRRYIPIYLALFFFGISQAQVPTDSELYKTLKANDSLLFDVGFNTCNLMAFQDLLADDLEFYHDKGGITESKKAFIDSFKNGICGSRSFKSRRELLPESLEVYPMYNDGTLYGAVQKGVHRFFESVNGQPESNGSTAKFTHLWLKTASGWKIKRVLSYDHQMVPKQKKEYEEIQIPKAELLGYVGTYKSPRAGIIDVSYNGTGLTVKAGQMELRMRPISKTKFFAKETALTFEFKTDEEGNVQHFIVFENGKKVENATKE